MLYNAPRFIPAITDRTITGFLPSFLPSFLAVSLMRMSGCVLVEYSPMVYIDSEKKTQRKKTETENRRETDLKSNIRVFRTSYGRADSVQ
jgi:hypothetical protein